MSQENQTIATTVTEVIIVGFPGLHPKFYKLVGFILCCLYVVIVVGNTFLVVAYAIEGSLQKPMYLIMLSLALSDIGFSTVALPKVIARYWFDNGVTPLYVCFIQRQLIHYFGTLNSLIMMSMALDRYLAICHPLRYPVLMTNRCMKYLTGFIWSSSMIAPAINTIEAAQLPFCGPNQIVHLFCDSSSIYKLSCADFSAKFRLNIGVALFVLLVPLFFIILSYLSIVVTVLQIADSKGRLKTFSTCGTQLCIISIYYVPRFVVYLAPYIPTVVIVADLKIALTLFYSLFPPLANPFIYCLRTKEIRQILLRWSALLHAGEHKVSIVSVSK